MMTTIKTVSGEKSTSSGATGHCSVSWVTSSDQLPAGLFERTFGKNLEGPWWYETLEASGLSDQFKFHYALISLDGEPVGVAPAFSMDMPMELVAPGAVLPILKALGTLNKRVLFQRTIFLGSPCADEGTVGLLPDVPLMQVAQALQNAVESLAQQMSADMIVWKDFPEAVVVELDGLVRDRGMFFNTSFPGTAVDLNGITSFESYVGSLSSNRRANFKKKLKKSRAFAPLNVEIVNNPPVSVLEELFPLFWQTYEKGETKFEKLNIDFFKAIAKVPNSWFVLLRDGKDERLVAFMLCFKLEDRVINKFIGINYNENKERFLYYRLWESAIDWAIKCGAQEFQCGQTGYRPKVDLGSKLIPLTNVCKHRNPLIHLIYRKIAEGIIWSTLDKELEQVLQAHPEYERSQPWKQPESQDSY